jgi:hypothetical protein
MWASSQNIARPGFHDRQEHPACGHAQHGQDKDVSSEAMPPATFAERHRQGAGEKPQAARKNMKSQYGRRSHTLNGIRAPERESSTFLFRGKFGSGAV